jgi:hypothetical protein
MSLEITKDPSGTCPSRSLGERNARERRHEGRLLRRTSGAGAFGGAEDFCESTRVPNAIRRAQDFHASLAESLAFLQTQDAALEMLEGVLKSSEVDADSIRREFEKLGGEKFNGQHLFAIGDEGSVYMNSPESADCVALNRPSLGAGYFLVDGAGSLLEEIAAARAENHREQAELEQILFTTPACVAGSEFEHGHIEGLDAAGKTTARTRESVLADARMALGAQANAAHSAVLRLFQ